MSYPDHCVCTTDEERIACQQYCEYVLLPDTLPGATPDSALLRIADAAERIATALEAFTQDEVAPTSTGFKET